VRWTVPLEERTPRALVFSEARGMVIVAALESPPIALDAKRGYHCVDLDGEGTPLQRRRFALVAFDLEDGSRQWSVPIAAEGELLVAEGELYLGEGQAIRVLDAASGRTRRRVAFTELAEVGSSPAVEWLGWQKASLCFTHSEGLGCLDPTSLARRWYRRGTWARPLLAGSRIYATH
jgi:hypothetical protein